MRKLSLEIDCYEYVELDDYLLSLDGINEVNITKDDLISIDVSYNEEIISDNIIELEIITFLELSKIPSVFSFDRHSNEKLELYKIERDSICCQYCYAGTVEDLFDIKGIDKVNSNAYDNFFERSYDERDKFVINVYYDPKIISLDKLKEIEKELII